MSDDEYLRQFEERSITHKEWNHRAHLKVAHLYLLRFPFGEALRRNCSQSLAQAPTDDGRAPA